MDWKLSIAGLFIGVLVGMTGMGGGSLMTPMLVFLFGFKPTVAIGTDIVHGAIFKSFGAVRHRQLGTVHARLTLWMLLGSAPFSLVGVALSAWLESPLRRRLRGHGRDRPRHRADRRRPRLRAEDLSHRAREERRSVHPQRTDKWIAFFLGVGGGFVVGLTSVGSGTFFGLVMLLVFPLTASKVVGTDIFHAAALLWVAGAGHLVAGNVDLHATGWLLIGSIPGVLLGSQVSISLPERTLRLCLATTLTLAGLKLAEVPGAGILILVVLSVAGVTLVGAGVRKLLLRGSAKPVPAAAEAGTTRTAGR